MGRFRQATRKQSRLRMALDGPPGAGKTFTSLRFAFALLSLSSNLNGTNGRVAVIDTERGSASKYYGKQPSADEQPWDFDVSELASFSPTEYTQAIKDAGRDKYAVLVIDSLSHAWAGKDGALEIKDKQGGNSYTAWKTVTPMHNAMVDAILQSPCHVIVTMRSKVGYVLETNEHGKQVPRRVGMEPVQRSGMEYEFDVYASMDWSNILTVSKSRCEAVNGAIFAKPNTSFLRPVVEWLEEGDPADMAGGMLDGANGSSFRRMRINDAQLAELIRVVHTAGIKPDTLANDLLKRYGVTELAELLPDQAEDFLRRTNRPARPARNGTANGAPSASSATSSATNGATNTPSMASPQPAAMPPMTNRGTITNDQIAALKACRDNLLNREAMTQEDWQAALAKRGVTSGLELSTEQAEELISKLRSRCDTLDMEENLYPDGPPPTAEQLLATAAAANEREATANGTDSTATEEENQA